MGQTTVKNIVNEAVYSLLDCTTKKQCNEIWELLLNRLKSHKSPNGGAISDNTLRRAVSDIRKGVQERAKKTKRHEKLCYWLLKEPIASDSGNDAKLGMLVVGKDIAQRSNEAKQTALLKRVSNKKKLNNFESLAKQAEQMLNSWDWRDIAVGIGLLTGRRAVEVMKTAKFTAPKGRTLKFEGQAKTKNSKAYRIPVLGSPVKIQKGLKRLREIKNLSGLDNNEVNQATHVALNRHTAKVLKPFTSSSVAFHDLRKIYATYAVNNIMGNEAIKDSNGNTANNERVFIQAILGHDNTETGLHYESWDVQ